MLGASLRHNSKGTYSEPHKLGSRHAKGIHDALAHSKGTVATFLQGGIGAEGILVKALNDRRDETHALMQPRAKNRRPRTDAQAKFAVWIPTCGDVVLER
jgi:hypothetical protein